MRARLVILAVVTTATLAGAGDALANAGGFAPAGPDSPNAKGITASYWFIFGFAAAIFLLVEVALVLFIVRFRSRGRSREVEGPQVRGHVKLEIAWTAVPVLILLGIAIFVFVKLPGINDVPSAGAAGSQLRVDVQGRQFYWQFTYPNGVVAINRLRVPVQRPVRLDVSAPLSDVIHSWWVPALGGKVDAIPGHPNHTWLEIKRPSTYTGQCAEFCGLQHAVMRATVEAVPAAEFAGWLTGEAKAQAAGTSDLGKQEFQGACATCHGPKGLGGIGPNLTTSAIARNRASLVNMVENGGKLMPPVGTGWSKRQLNALVAYVNKHVVKPAGATSGG